MRVFTRPCWSRLSRPEIAEFSNTPSGVCRQGPWLLTPLPVQRVHEACLESLADPPVSYTEGSATELVFAAHRLMGGRMRLHARNDQLAPRKTAWPFDKARGSPEARAATPDPCRDIQVQGRLLDLPHVVARAVYARFRRRRFWGGLSPNLRAHVFDFARDGFWLSCRSAPALSPKPAFGEHALVLRRTRSEAALLRMSATGALVV